MKVYEFRSTKATPLRAFTIDPAGQGLPGRRSNWRRSRAYDIPLGLLVGTEIGSALDAHGQYISRSDDSERELLELLYQ